MKKNIIFVLMMLFMIAAIGGCKSKSETLEEKLIDQEWSVVAASGDSGIMKFYKNNTAVFEGNLIRNGYEWSIEEEQLTLIYGDDTFIFDVTEDNSDGYTFSLIGGDYSSVYTSYDELKLTPAN